MATGQGNVIFDFGSPPGTNVVTTVVTDTGISAGSKVDLYLMGTDSSNNFYSIIVFSIDLSLVKSNVSFVTTKTDMTYVSTNNQDYTVITTSSNDPVFVRNNGDSAIFIS